MYWLILVKVLLFFFVEFFSVDQPRKFELLSLCISKGGHKACFTTFESNLVGRSTKNIRQSKIKAPLLTYFKDCLQFACSSRINFFLELDT